MMLINYVNQCVQALRRYYLLGDSNVCVKGDPYITVVDIRNNEIIDFDDVVGD